MNDAASDRLLIFDEFSDNWKADLGFVLSELRNKCLSANILCLMNRGKFFYISSIIDEMSVYYGKEIKKVRNDITVNGLNYKVYAFIETYSGRNLIRCGIVYVSNSESDGKIFDATKILRCQERYWSDLRVDF